MTLSEVLPELVGDVVGALIREGRGRVADQLPGASLVAWEFDDFAQTTYLQLSASRNPDAVGETLSFSEDIGVNVDLDKEGKVMGLEVAGYEQLLSRLGKDPSA